MVHIESKTPAISSLYVKIILLDEDYDLDIPAEFTDISAYRAKLGHKVKLFINDMF